MPRCGQPPTSPPVTPPPPFAYGSTADSLPASSPGSRPSFLSVETNQLRTAAVALSPTTARSGQENTRSGTAVHLSSTLVSVWPPASQSRSRSTTTDESPSPREQPQLTRGHLAPFAVGSPSTLLLFLYCRRDSPLPARFATPTPHPPAARAAASSLPSHSLRSSLRSSSPLVDLHTNKTPQQQQLAAATVAAARLLPFSLAVSLSLAAEQIQRPGAIARPQPPSQMVALSPSLSVNLTWNKKTAGKCVRRGYDVDMPRRQLRRTRGFPATENGLVL